MQLLLLEQARLAPVIALRELHLLYTLLYFAIVKIIHWTLFWFPSQKSQIVAAACKRTAMHTTNLSVEQWQDSIVTWQSYRSLCRSVALDVRKSVRQGGPAANSGVVTLDETPRRLLDYQRGVRPLVLIFGSST